MDLGGKKLSEVLKDSAFLTLSVFLVSYPYLYHWLVHRPDHLSPYNAKVALLSGKGLTIFVFTQIFIFLLLVFLCSFVGFGFSEKYGLKGLGALKEVKNDIKYYIFAAPALSILLYFLFDRLLMEKIPTLYPNQPLWGLAKALMTSSAYETVSKFGLVTVVMGVFRNKHAAVMIPAVFFAFLVKGTFGDYGVEFDFNYLSVFGIVSSLIYGIASGYIYIYRGLLSVFVLRFILDLKYLIYPLIS